MKLSFLCRVLISTALLLPVAAARAASLQTVDEKKFVGELHFTDANAVQVKPVGSEPVIVPLTNVLSASFSRGPFLSSGSVLPNGWAIQDVGETRGSTRLDEDTFTMRVEGQVTNASACHFVGRPMHSDGEILARIDEVSGTAARAGVMMRARDGSVFASLACDADGKIWFERRPEKDRREIHAVVVANIPAPVWLRLYKRDKFVVAFVSRDGMSWEMAGRDSIQLLLERTWREHEGEMNLLRASMGVFTSSRSKGALATGRVAQVSLTLNGLLGEYFADSNFNKLAFTRLDPQVRFDWRTSKPDPLFANKDFSVRWTGNLVPLRSAMARFYFEGDDEARLWIDDEEIQQLSVKETTEKGPVHLAAPAAVRLMAGQPVKIKMEFRDGAAPASVRLAWATPGDRTDVIGMTNFVFSFTATNSPDHVVPRAENNSPPVRGVVLRNGSFIAGAISAADESAVKLSFGGRKEVLVLNSRVARIVLRPPRQSLAYGVAVGRTGVFLKNGDFFESEFRGVTHGGLQMSSVLFGARRFSIEGGDATVVILNDFRPAVNTFEIRLLDGSVLRASKMSADTRTLTIEEPVLGSIVIPVAEVWEINRGKGLESLTQ